MSYTLPDGLNRLELYSLLEQIYRKYLLDYPDLYAMIYLFAQDDFYKGHLIAKRYIELDNEFWVAL
jgi:hypothetical protein